MVREWLRGVVDDLAATVFPAECRVCHNPLVRAGLVPVCDRCLSEVRLQKGPLCPTCGEALGMESERFAEGFGPKAQICTPCRRVPPAFTRAAAFGVYETELRDLIHLFKYEQLRGLADPLGVMLAGAVELLSSSISPESDLLVVAVPLFRSKKNARGYNHAELLADAAIRHLRRRNPKWHMRPAHNLLERVRETESQFGLTPHGRRANLRGAFAAPDAAALGNRDVLLVDDIYTTGATARTCAEVLRRAGARSVLVATVARAQVESVALWDASNHPARAVEHQQQFAAATGGHR